MDCNNPDHGCDPLYMVEWASIIKQIRNHPCVFDYTMDNGNQLWPCTPGDTCLMEADND